MMKAYICSPYRAKDDEEFDRNIEYAQELTRKALDAGLAPITPHLYMTQCLNEDNPKERERGMAAGTELLKGCDLVIAGARYGISEGMGAEIAVADAAGMDVVNADRLGRWLGEKARRGKGAYGSHGGIGGDKGDDSGNH